MRNAFVEKILDKIIGNFFLNFIKQKYICTCSEKPKLEFLMSNVDTFFRF